LVAQQNKIIYFIEVKYRRGDSQGDGFEYITAKKQHKMNFAAEIWRQHYKWSGDYRLLAAAVSGADCQQIELIEVD
jgi:Holliday junction resolvase-like predicted endonuclease